MAIRVRRKRRDYNPKRWKLHKPKWIDPYPGVPGTEPEKRLFAHLVQRRIFFIFQGNLSDLGSVAAASGRHFAPDIIIPEYKVILDPFSEFHHALPEQAVRDAEKAELYTAWGWSFYHPWAHEITDDYGVIRFMASVAELRGPKTGTIPEKYKPYARTPGYFLGPNLGAGAKSVGAANRSRRKFAPKNFAIGTRRRRY